MISEKTSKKIFPPPLNNDYSKLLYDNEGLWSITHTDEAEKITNTILKYKNKFCSIVDLNGGCGGNLISFMKYFDDVTAVEIDLERYKFMVNNINCYEKKSVKLINDDCLNVIKQKEFDIYFFDPPWGGPKYKKMEKIELYLSNIKLSDIVDLLPNKKLVVIKVPFNYDIELIKCKFKIIETLEFGNVNILFFNT